ncbi:MAG: hypothetical protein IJR87_02160, partial [Bacteroidaceae bacterium]|nr:hypothetical protein [Bacteroidaceae bacterium]
MAQKVQISQDTLYQYITEHGIKLVRLAELTGLSEASINSCFKHQIINKGTPRSFTAKAVVKLNAALEQIADNLRGSILTFGSDQTYTNQRGKTYDPELVEPLKQIGELLNLTALVGRVLGWSKDKKENVLVTKSSKVYGNISEDDVNRINAELLSIAGVLSSYEVVPDEGSSETINTDKQDDKPVKTNNKGTRTRNGMEGSSELPKNEWDDTSLPLQERSRLLRERWSNGMLLFRVNGGYTAEGDDANYV